MTTLDIAISLGLNPKKVSANEYGSACPFCGGNDRFRIWPAKGQHGTYWCRQCQAKGDGIKLVMEKLGKSFREACLHIGKDLPARRRSRTPVAPRKAAVEFTPRQTSGPADLWQQRAADFAEACHELLLKTPGQLAWLAARGITAESVKRFKLGWNHNKRYGKRAEWGVENETITDNAQPKVLDLLVLHRGLVLPYYLDGRIESLRIRRPEDGLDNRYHVVKGSSSKPMMIYCPEKATRGTGAWIIVESRLDAVLIAQDAGDIVNVSALDSVATRPDEDLYAELRKAEYIMNCMDYDAAGAKARGWWAERFPQAERWVVPRGKDPGDYRAEGGDIREWVIAGLPYGLRPRQPAVKDEGASVTSLAPARPWMLLESELLGERVVLLKDPAAYGKMREAHPGLVVYLPSEIQELQKIANDEKIKAAHLIKKILGATVLSVTPAKGV